MLRMVIEKCQERGFERYEISAFAKEGFYSRHNLGYWTERPFLGFGPSAFSYWGGARFQNVKNINRYAKLLSEKKDPVDFYEKLPPKKLHREGLAIGLRVLSGVCKTRFPLNLLKRLKILNFVEEKNQKIRLTEKGKLFYDSVAEEIIL